MVLIPILRLIGIHPATRAAEVIARVVAISVMVGVLAWAVRRVKSDRELWPTILVALTAYLLLTPWFLYWYIVAPLVLVSVLPRGRLTDPILTFSGAALFTTFPTGFLSLLAQTAGRYAPPFAVYALRLKGRATERGASGATQTVIRIPATAATTRQATAAE